MDICDIDHDEVCYESRSCPVCSLRKELQDRIDDLETQVDYLENIDDGK